MWATVLSIQHVQVALEGFCNIQVMQCAMVVWLSRPLCVCAVLPMVCGFCGVSGRLKQSGVFLYTRISVDNRTGCCGNLRYSPSSCMPLYRHKAVLPCCKAYVMTHARSNF